jgi:hypothetical protein
MKSGQFLLNVRSNTSGATSGGGTAAAFKVTRQVLVVEEELPTLQK